MSTTLDITQFEKYLYKRVSAGTVGVYLPAVKKYLASANGNAYDREYAQEYIDKLTEDGMSPSTINTRAHAIMRWFRWCGNEIHLDCPTVRLKEPKYLSMDDLRRNMDACRTQLEKTLVIVLFDTAVRIRELLYLRREDIDYTNKLIKVMRKGGQSESVNIGDKALLELKKWLALSRPVSNRVFEGVDYHSAWSRLKAVGKTVGLQINPHIYRHTRAIQMLLNGADLHDVQVHLGHRSLSTTANIYGRFKAVDVRDRIPSWE